MTEPEEKLSREQREEALAELEALRSACADLEPDSLSEERSGE